VAGGVPAFVASGNAGQIPGPACKGAVRGPQALLHWIHESRSVVRPAPWL